MCVCVFYATEIKKYRYIGRPQLFQNPFTLIGFGYCEPGWNFLLAILGKIGIRPWSYNKCNTVTPLYTAYPIAPVILYNRTSAHSKSPRENCSRVVGATILIAIKTIKLHSAQFLLDQWIGLQWIWDRNAVDRNGLWRIFGIKTNGSHQWITNGSHHFNSIWCGIDGIICIDSWKFMGFFMEICIMLIGTLKTLYLESWKRTMCMCL